MSFVALLVVKVADPCGRRTLEPLNVGRTLILYNYSCDYNLV